MQGSTPGSTISVTDAVPATVPMTVAASMAPVEMEVEPQSLPLTSIHSLPTTTSKAPLATATPSALTTPDETPVFRCHSCGLYFARQGAPSG